MINIVNGNILDCKENIICHQCNVFGHMSGGVARQLANKYKGLEEAYSMYCKNYNNDYKKLKGDFCLYQTIDKKIICNMFSQKPNFDTDYIEMEKALKHIKYWARIGNASICMPYGIGCGIANGNWDIVYKIIKEVFNDYDVTLYKLDRS